MVVGGGIGHAELDDGLLEERRVGQLGTLLGEILADIKYQLIENDPNKAGEQR